MNNTIFFLAAVISLAVCGSAQTAAPVNIYAAGVSYNPSATPVVAGTGLYARKVGDSGTYAFSAVDVLPTTVKPLVVTTQFSAGVAQRILTIGGVAIYVPTSAGISTNGTNTGWAWTAGAMGVVSVKDKWKIMPNVRVVKSSVSNGTGYQVIVGALFGFAE